MCSQISFRSLKYFNFFLLFVLVIFLGGCGESDKQNTLPEASGETPTSSMIMYEVNPSAFSPGHDLNGITARLDALRNMGINTLWIMPTYPIGVLNSFGSPYCVKDYTGVNPDLGTLQDLKNLVDQAHAKNMNVLLDWVGNHTSWDNAWINDHPDWYTHNASGNIIHPEGTNWNDVADLDYSSQPLREAMIAAMQYWVDTANVDGFRCDAADFIPFTFWQQAIAKINADSGHELIWLAEGARHDHFLAGFQMNFGWDFLAAEKSAFATGSAQAITAADATENEDVPNGKRKLRFTTNHDESNIQTPIQIYGSQNAAIAASVPAIFLQGVPLIYSGQEVGVASPESYANNNVIDWSANPEMLAQYSDLLHFYSENEVARNGVITSFSSSDVVGFTKTLNTNKMLVLVNIRAIEKSLTLNEDLSGNWINALTGETVSINGLVILQGDQYLVLTR